MRRAEAYFRPPPEGFDFRGVRLSAGLGDFIGPWPAPAWPSLVLVVRVHPEILARQRLPRTQVDRDFWRERFEGINAFERHLTRNGTVVLKFFLHVSKEEQRRRILDRLEQPEKHWKFSYGDLEERRLWDRYMAAFEKAISATSTGEAPWYVIPADHKWVMRALVSHVIVHRLQALDLRFPKPDAEKKAAIQRALAELRAEGKSKKAAPDRLARLRG